MSQTAYVYAALSWAAFAFGGVWAVCWLIRPRTGRFKAAYWSLVFKSALLCGAASGLMALFLGAGFIWDW